MYCTVFIKEQASVLLSQQDCVSVWMFTHKVCWAVFWSNVKERLIKQSLYGRPFEPCVCCPADFVTPVILVSTSKQLSRLRIQRGFTHKPLLHPSAHLHKRRKSSRHQSRKPWECSTKRASFTVIYRLASQTQRAISSDGGLRIVKCSLKDKDVLKVDEKCVDCKLEMDAV